MPDFGPDFSLLVLAKTITLKNVFKLILKKKKKKKNFFFSTVLQFIESSN